MASVTFPPAVGGDGSTVTDDNNATTGVGNGGHRTRFVPALAQIVALANYIAATAGNVPNAVWTPCRLMTTANDTLSGLAARDGITPNAGERVFVRLQTTSTQNGPYIAAAGAWTRATDADSSAEFVSGKSIIVQEGTLGAGTQWYLSTTGAITLNTTPLSFLAFPSLTEANTWTMAATFQALVAAQLGLTVSGAPLNMTAQPINEAQGADVASAATINLDASTGDQIDVTGSTGITAVTLAAGRTRIVRFTGTPSLTNSANLVISGGTVTVGAGDYYLMIGRAGSVVMAILLERAAAKPVYPDVSPTFTQPVALSGAALNVGQASDIASASSVNLDAASGNNLNISGTATITAVTLSNGRQRIIRATGAWSITHGASLVVLPGLASRTVAVGDIVEFIGISGVVYARIFSSGVGTTSIISGSISTGGDTTITLPSGAFSKATLVITGLRAATDYAAYLRINSDTGANYDYASIVTNFASSVSMQGQNTTGLGVSRNDQLFDDSGTTQNPASLEMEIFGPSSSADFKNVIFKSCAREASGTFDSVQGSGRWKSASAVSSLGVLLRASTGGSPTGTTVNASAGTYTLTCEF